MKNLLLLVFFTLILNGCGYGYKLSTIVTSGVIGDVVLGNIFSKVAFDPVWEWTFGDPVSHKLNSFKKEFSNEVTDVVINKLTRTSKIINGKFECESNEEKSNCKNRAASIAQYEFDIYATGFVQRFNRCRDYIVFSKKTGSLDYVKQVDLITKCISSGGYQKEVSLILKHVRRKTYE